MRIDSLFPISQELVIRYPDGKKGWSDGSLTDIKFKVVSADAKQFHAVITKHAQAALGREDELTITERQQQTAEQVAACITGWTGLEDEKGTIPFSGQKAVELMQTPELAFIREQVEGFVVRRSNFFRSSTAEPVQLRGKLGEAELLKQNGDKPPTSTSKQPKTTQESGQIHQTN